MKAAQWTGWPEVAPVPFLNSDPMAHLVGHSNEAPVIVDRQRTTALIDLGAQVSIISSQFSKILLCQNPCKDCGWLGHPCQPSATSGPPD